MWQRHVEWIMSDTWFSVQSVAEAPGKHVGGNKRTSDHAYGPSNTTIVTLMNRCLISTWPVEPSQMGIKRLDGRRKAAET